MSGLARIRAFGRFMCRSELTGPPGWIAFWGVELGTFLCQCILYMRILGLLFSGYIKGDCMALR